MNKMAQRGVGAEEAVADGACEAKEIGVAEMERTWCGASHDQPSTLENYKLMIFVCESEVAQVTGDNLLDNVFQHTTAIINVRHIHFSLIVF
jgi:hypothetical protein